MHAALIFAVFASLGSSPAPPQNKTLPPEASNFICGPRCVKRVLEHYGQHVELIDLVRELQGVAVDRPASLAVMKAALEQHGIHVVGIQLRPSDLRWLCWQGPTIAHLAGSGSEGGHFCVVFPAHRDGSSLCVWDGLDGTSMRPIDEFAAEASGVILLTSRLPIPEQPECLDRGGWIFPLGATVVIVPAIVFLLVRANWRRV